MGITVSEATASIGRWVTPEVNYVDPERRFCAYCGRPIARQYWEVAAEDTGEPEAFCTPEHAARRAAASEQAVVAS